ncbi:MAG: very short patch repair endonuclease, partial [Terracidiphilus sp.]
YRFRLHQQDLPGRPDLVFASRRKIIFVHGCFWHLHDCKSAHLPKSNRTYWIPKLKRNQVRDRKNLLKLRAMGWKALTIWECEIGDAALIRRRVKSFLGARKMAG